MSENDLKEVKQVSEVDGFKLHVLRLQMANFNLEYAAAQVRFREAQVELERRKETLADEYRERYGVSLDAVQTDGSVWFYHVSKEG